MAYINENIMDTFNDISSLNKFMEEMNESYIKRYDKLTKLEKAKNLSESKFLKIKNTFENMSPSLFESSYGKTIINNFTNEVKANKSLSNMYSLCESIRKGYESDNLDYVLESLSNLNANIDTVELNEGCKKLGKILAESYFCLGASADSLICNVDDKLSEAVEYIAKNRKNIKNINEYSNAIKFIKENIDKKEDTVNENKDVNEQMLEFNMKYNRLLTNEEKEMIKEMSDSSNHEYIFNKYKKLCTKSLNEAKLNFEKNGDTESVNKINEISEKILQRQFSKETINSDVINFIEMSHIFD